MPVRQAGVIYLKNMVTQFWSEKEVENLADPVPFSIHEQDRQTIREHIIEAIIHAPDVIRYKRCEERSIMDQTMKLMLPLLYQRMQFQLLPDPSELSNLLQKQILKIFYAFTQNYLPQDVVTKEVFTQWMEIIRQIVEHDVPLETNQIDEEERPELAWWKRLACAYLENLSESHMQLSFLFILERFLSVIHTICATSCFFITGHIEPLVTAGIQRKIYKDQAELMLTTHDLPRIHAVHMAFLRPDMPWVIRYFCELKFHSENNMVQAVEAVKSCCWTDKDLPVRVEAQPWLCRLLITEQERAKVYLQPFIKPVVFELLNVIRETENDDLTGVMQRLVCTYVEEVTPLAVEMTSHLAQTFAQVLDTDTDGSEEKAITALGILNTMETILNVMEDQKEIILQLEGIVLNVIGIILQQNIMDFYEEVLSLIYSLTSAQVSSHMWEVLTGDVGEDAEVHAAKLMEVVLLQCSGKVDMLLPMLVELALQRLTREVQTSELRTMCLQVVIAALYTRPQLLLDTLTAMHIPNVQGSILAQFLKQWLHDADCFLGLHDRKLSVLGLCSLLTMTNSRPPELTSMASEMLPALLVLFQGLKRAYACHAQEENDSDEEEEEEEVDHDAEVLASDEDEIDEEGQQYLERLAKGAGNEDDDTDGEYSDSGAEETQLESFQTPLDDERCPVDEYVAFKEILSNLQAADSAWYAALTAQLTPQQQREIEDIFKLADQRKAASGRENDQKAFVFQSPKRSNREVAISSQVAKSLRPLTLEQLPMPNWTLPEVRPSFHAMVDWRQHCKNALFSL
ncbi:hypothetical protein C0Q70_05478 [Pomacea canaliculata]|uniref:Importin N-terminal domain-containing protein n=1 Tax=Pomacea canaliculata TaxID=400727 RepID=A0A2T7PLD9_POMCA|nr:hypothetical protein C0Q70_05478 [Pomacea canaliculata]